MAQPLIARASADFTTATTWGTLWATGTSTTYNTNTGLTNTVRYSANFAGDGTNDIEGVAVVLMNRNASPSGTATMVLRNTTDNVDVSSVTVNISDIHADIDSSTQAWTFFKFSGVQTLTAGKNFAIGLSTSAASGQINAARTSTNYDWLRMLRRTTSAAPTTGDTLYILGEKTGAGTYDAISVNMNNNDTTEYGPVVIGDYGTLSHPIGATSNLRLTGSLTAWPGATYSKGTSGGGIGSSYTATLEFNCASDGQYGFEFKNGSTFNDVGATLTYDRCYMAANVSVGGSSFTSDVSTGWANGDRLVVASTDNTAGHWETVTLNGAASGTTVNINGTWAYAHLGGADIYKAEVINVTRNSTVKAVTLSLTYSATLQPKATYYGRHCAYWGIGGTNGFSAYTSTGGTCDMQKVAFYDCEYGLRFRGSNNTTANVTLKDCVFGDTYFSFESTTANTDCECDNIWVISSSAAAPYINLLTFPISNITVTSVGSNALLLGNSGAASIPVSDMVTGTFITHSNSYSGIVFYNLNGQGHVIPANFISWRDGWGSAIVAGHYFSACHDLIFTGDFTNYAARLRSFAFNSCDNLNFWGTVTTAGDTTYGTDSAIEFYGDPSGNIRISNGSFGVATGIYVAHTRDVYWGNSTVVTGTLYADNCLMPTGPVARLNHGQAVYSSNHGQVAGATKAWVFRGTWEHDDTWYHNVTTARSSKYTPNSATYALETPHRHIPVVSGGTATVTVWTRTSTVASGGALYNGDLPTLKVKQYASMGVSADTVLDTATSAAGWQQLSGSLGAAPYHGVYKVYVSLTGTAGFLNLDDWDVA